MGLNDTPTGERVQIGFFGLRNSGKSSLVNAVTGQDLSVVSDVLGTTTDPVIKSMELLPIGPVVIIDTPGMDDSGKLGNLRVEKAQQVLRRCDIAVLVSEAGRELTDAENELIELIKQRGIPYIIALNKADLIDPEQAAALDDGASMIPVSALLGTNIYELKERIGVVSESVKTERHLIADMLEPGDMVVLVMPIDASAPKGRLIIPEQMAVRDVLDADATCAVCQPAQLAQVLDGLKEPPRIVVTDSQAFAEVAAIVPEDVPLTSFSILMARYKADLGALMQGARELSGLTDDSHVLIAEGCTHHRQCQDIGTVKMPAWIRAACGADPKFDFCSGGTFPEELDGVDLVVHCGGCMLNQREMCSRVDFARKSGTPIVNYGVAIAKMHGILDRCVEPFDEELSESQAI